MKISVCLIARDEELVIERVLHCAKAFADEIIVVDTGSADKTKAIAERNGCRAYDFEWCDDFSRARNYAFSKARYDYMMWLDADDYVSPENAAKINEIKGRDNPADVYFMKYATAFDGRNRPTFCFMRERLVRNDPAYHFSDPIHEAITPSGRVEYTDIVIEHRKIKPSDPRRNLRIFEKLRAANTPFSPRMQFYYANELYYNDLFAQAIAAYDEFLLQRGSFVENRIQACLNRAKCYYKLNAPEHAIESLFLSFAHDSPRSEVLCELSLYLINAGRYREALYWLKLAVQPPNINSGAFVLPECYDFIPYYNSAICYHRLGDNKTAKTFALKACKANPTSSDARHNYEYFKKLLKAETAAAH